MQPPLDPLQLVTTDEDYQRILPLELSAADAKLLYAVLRDRIQDDEVERGKAYQMHTALLAKLYYYLTDKA
ncbi:hypothetical protein [Lewinella sp. JB7]|uniref:hypothetical protein n=1 Tax=Lewinella sp. JB7 TaxID=2962887 RepID=UPI0020C99C4F|nr:hypothetical protein [Lewinella sp. JB7]MCP9237918.1 hypothetical protein [Lewinella sp. JB7]